MSKDKYEQFKTEIESVKDIVVLQEKLDAVNAELATRGEEDKENV